MPSILNDGFVMRGKCYETLQHLYCPVAQKRRRQQILECTALHSGRTCPTRYWTKTNQNDRRRARKEYGTARVGLALFQRWGNTV